MQQHRKQHDRNQPYRKEPVPPVREEPRAYETQAEYPDTLGESIARGIP